MAFFFSWGMAEAVAVVLAVGQVVVLDPNVTFSVMMKIKILKSIKSKKCSWHLCSDQLCFMKARGGLCRVGLIPILDPNSRI